MRISYREWCGMVTSSQLLDWRYTQHLVLCINNGYMKISELRNRVAIHFT